MISSLILRVHAKKKDDPPQQFSDRSPYELAKERAQQKVQECINLVRREKMSGSERFFDGWFNILTVRRLEGKIFYTTLIGGIAVGMAYSITKKVNPYQVILLKSLLPCYISSLILTSTSVRNRVEPIDWVIASAVPTFLTMMKIRNRNAYAVTFLAACSGGFAATTFSTFLGRSNATTIDQYRLMQEEFKFDASRTLREAFSGKPKLSDYDMSKNEK